MRRCSGRRGRRDAASVPGGQSQPSRRHQRLRAERWICIGAHGYVAVLWSPYGTPTVLDDVGGKHDSIPYAINVAGQSVGISYTNLQLGRRRRCFGRRRATATVLQDAGGQHVSGAVAINASGQSVGYSATRPVMRRSCGRPWGTRPCSKKWAAGFSAAPSPSTPRGKALGFL